MYKKTLAIFLLSAIAGCGPSQQPAEQNPAPPPAAAPPAAAPPPAAAAAPAPAAAPSAADEEQAKVREEERKLAKLKKQEAALQAQNAAAQSAPATAPAPAAPQPCQDCGTIASITPVRAEGQAGLIGTLGGAAAGGLAGSQFGKGRGNTAMTVLGAVGGALAGREVEKQVTASTAYQVAVNMEAGGSQTVTVASVTGLSVGSRVHVSGNNLTPY